MIITATTVLQADQMMVVPGLTPRGGVLVCFAAGLGTTAIGTCARPAVAAAPRFAVTPTTGFVVRPSDLFERSELYFVRGMNA